MFDGLTKSKFFNKCKSDIKLIRTRIEIIRRKRNASQKYLRNDIADLLRNGFDVEAFGRAKGLLSEMARSQCYELIDQYCEHILKNLAVMNKQRECPEDCREAASSLMYAAARIADLPELRELRTMFSERYGNSLDYYVNKQLSEKLKPDPPSNDTKLHLLQEIAAEYGVELDSEALENKLFKAPAYDKKVVKGSNDSDGMNGFDDKAGTGTGIGTGTGYEVSKARENTYYGERLPSKRNEGLKQKMIPPPPYTKPELNKEKSSSSYESESSEDKDDAKLVRKTSPDEKETETNKENVAQGQRISEGDEEERILDKLLRYYSRLKGANQNNGKPEAGKTMRASSVRVESEPARDSPMKHSRAASFHPGVLNGNVHVHPKLPDYDEFLARLAAFRGK